jgi:hypothetical protein
VTRAVLLLALALAACAGDAELATSTGALGSGAGPGYGSGSGGEDGPPPDPCAGQFPWTLCIADLNTWQKAPYVDSCWLGAPKLLPVHTTMEVVVTCYDTIPKVEDNQCRWRVEEWELDRKENKNHGTPTSAVCDHGPRKGEKLLIKTHTESRMTDPLGGFELLGSVTCDCDGYNTFMGQESLEPPSNLIDEVIAALRNTECDLTNMTPAELAAAAASMLWHGTYGPLWQCAGNALQQIRDRFHACNNDAATQQDAFRNGGECPAADDLPGFCKGPRWYF